MGYALSLFALSSLTDFVGAKRVYLGSMTVSAFFSLGFALFARGYLSALVLYTLVGISLGGTYTTGLIILADQYPTERRGMASGCFIASTSISYVLSLVLSGISLPHGGYRLSFLVTCLGPLVGSILSWLTLAKTKVSFVRRQIQQSFRKEVLTNRPARLLIGGYTCHTWELLGMWAWAPAFLSTCLAIRGTSTLSAAGLGAHFTAALHMAGLIASLAMGSLSDRFGRARVIMTASAISTICSFVFGWSIGWSFIMVVGIALLYGFSALGDSPVLSAALTEVVTPSYLGAAFGLRSLLGFGAGAISPLVFGVVMDWSNPLKSAGAFYVTWGWAFSVFGLAGFGAVWAAYRLREFETDAGGLSEAAES
jgi:MFS family permease